MKDEITNAYQEFFMALKMFGVVAIWLAPVIVGMVLAIFINVWWILLAIITFATLPLLVIIADRIVA